MKTVSTQISIFNENGILFHDEIKDFCDKVENQDSIEFEVLNGEPDTSVFKIFRSENLEFLVFNHGYVMSIEGDIRGAIMLLREIDKALMPSKRIYVSASQRVENDEERAFERGLDIDGIAQYLDKEFSSTDYSSALES